MLVYEPAAVRAGHTDSVESAAFSPVLPLCATAGIDGQLLLWDNATFSQRAACSHPEVGAWTDGSLA